MEPGHLAVPDEIVAEVVAREKAMGWPDCVARFVEFEQDGKQLFTLYKNTTVADCEQFVEHHTRKGWAAVERWKRTGRRATAKCAAYHIYTARLMRCRYIELMEIEDLDSTLADMPFSVERHNEKA